MMDPAKLKVVELRAELLKRGLETKGNKPVLVERLRKALEEDTEDTAEEEATDVDSGEENVVEMAHKDARQKTPELVTPSKTKGRTSRSKSAVAATTPTKVSPVRGSPKIILTPLTEKQIVTPEKSPIAEKTARVSETTETKSEETRVVERKDEAIIEAPSESVEETPVELSEPIVPEVIYQVTEKPQSEPIEEPKIEEEKVESEREDSVGASNEQEEESLRVIPEVSEDTSEINRDVVEHKGKEESEEQPIAEETTYQPPDDANFKDNANLQDDANLQNYFNLQDEEQLPRGEETKAEVENRDFAETMEPEVEEPEVKEPEVEEPEVEEDENSSKIEITEALEDSSNHGETSEEKPDVLLKEEIDEKPNVDDTLQPDEQPQDVKMRHVKLEAEDDSKDRDRKDRKDRKRKRSSSPQEEKAKSPPPGSKNEPDLNEADVVLSWYDSDLNLVINRESFLSATAMHNDGFGYIWAGARASYGFTAGKVYFEVKITEYCEVNLQDEQSPHVLRVGWSVQGTSMQLGEEPLTYGFGGTGKISSGNRFIDYGEPFGKDDVVGCYVDLTDNHNIVISYTINGKNMGTAFTVAKNNLNGKPLYPHVLTKNCTFACNFGQEKPWCENILEDYVPVGSVDLKNRVHGPRRPEKIEDCEIIMMCGLPAAGKTVWATKYALNNPEKMYNVLGTNSLIEKMKVIGLPRRRNYHGRWEILIEKCTRCLNKLLEMASTRRRNYILDQTNVYPSAQRRKMRNFYGYQRRAVVIVPTDEEFKSRTAKRTASEGDVVPDSAVLEMKANFGAPVVGEMFDSVEWIELPAEEGKKLIDKYNKEGKEAGYGQQQATKRPRFERSDNHRDNRDSRQNSRDSRDSRDHRDRRNNYPDRNRNSTWRGGSNSGGWRDRQPRPTVGHARHGGSSSGGGSSGGGSGYGGPSGGGWRGRGGSASGPPSSYRPPTDRRAASGHDRRTSGSDRNRSIPSRQAAWGAMSSYQNSHQPSGSWGGGSQTSWQGSQSQQQSSWGSQPGSWGQQQWGNWKGYGQGNNYSQGNYGQQSYGNGNWGGWNQQYYNQYWGQQQPTGQTSAAGSQAGNTSSSTPTGNSTTSASSTYSNYPSSWQGYTQSYGYSAESSNTNAQQQK